MGETTLWKDLAERGKEIKPNSLALKTNTTFHKTIRNQHEQRLTRQYHMLGPFSKYSLHFIRNFALHACRLYSYMLLTCHINIISSL